MELRNRKRYCRSRTRRVEERQQRRTRTRSARLLPVHRPRRHPHFDPVRG
ncbi:unnamed protein product [Tenebrio molitor]|nr:unnamed protein product [Tenebrio molitor]